MHDELLKNNYFLVHSMYSKVGGLNGTARWKRTVLLYIADLAVCTQIRYVSWMKL